MFVVYRNQNRDLLQRKENKKILLFSSSTLSIIYFPAQTLIQNPNIRLLHSRNTV